MSRFKSYREESKRDYGQQLEDNQNMYNDQIKLGAILRIADAAELMAKNHQKLIEERDRYKRWNESEREITKRLYNRIAGLRGYISRLKKQKAKK